MPDRTWMSYPVKTKKHQVETLGSLLRKDPQYLAWMIRAFASPADLRAALDKAEAYLNETDPTFFERHSRG